MKMKIEQTASISGHFLLHLTRGDGSIETYRAAEAGKDHNLITNAGMDSIGTTGGSTNPSNTASCVVGTGTTAPANTDTSLASYLAGHARTDGPSLSIQTGYGRQVHTYKFAQGAVVGNLAEVGVASASDGTGTLFSRALILDSNGNPTTITVTSIDILTVTYEIRLYWPTADTSTQLTDGGTTYTVTGRALDTTAAGYWANYITQLAGGGGNNTWYSTKCYSGPLVAMDSSSPQGYLGVGYYTRGTTTSGTYSRDDSILFGINDVNGSIKTVTWTSQLGNYQFQFDPVISKDNTKTLSLTRTISWARHA